MIWNRPAQPNRLDLLAREQQIQKWAGFVNGIFRIYNMNAAGLPKPGGFFVHQSPWEKEEAA